MEFKEGFIITIIALIVVYSAFQTVNSLWINPNMCPIHYENGTYESIPCYSVNWNEFCESIGCQKQSFSCGRPGCQCDEEYFYG